MKKPVMAIVLASCATIVLAVNAAASYPTTHYESIRGTELPNATPIEGQFVGTAVGSYNGSFYIDVRHEVLANHPIAITGGSFRLDTLVGGWPNSIDGVFTGGTVAEFNRPNGCGNQHYHVTGTLGGVGVDGGTGSGTFSATLTHYRHNVWWFGCVVYGATITGSVSLTF